MWFIAKMGVVIGKVLMRRFYCTTIRLYKKKSIQSPPTDVPKSRKYSSNPNQVLASCTGFLKHNIKRVMENGIFKRK